MGRKIGVVPDSMKGLAEELQQFRSTHAIRTRLPEGLWQKAVEAAQQHGVYVVARSLGLDYSSMQKRMDGRHLGQFAIISGPQMRGTGATLSRIIIS